MVKIVADTTSSISPQEASRLGIDYLPQIIIFENDSYRDDCEIDTPTFLSKLRASPVLPKTAAPPPALYHPIYQRAIDAGEQVVVICPSAELSGTLRSATIAAQDFHGADIRIVDSRTVGSGLASIVLQAVEWAAQGMDADALVAAVEDMVSRQRVYFLLDTLEYLKKGGRIGGAQAMVGGLLQVKPILTLKNGRAEAAESQRTRRRAQARLKELVAAEYPQKYPPHLTVMHADALNEARQLASELEQVYHVTNIPIYETPPAFVVHAGPGVLAVSFFIDNPA